MKQEKVNEWVIRKRFKKEPIHLLNLPDELFVHIFQYLGIQEKPHVSIVCKKFKMIPFTYSYFVGSCVLYKHFCIQTIIQLKFAKFLFSGMTDLFPKRIIEYILDNRKKDDFAPFLNQIHEYHFYHASSYINSIYQIRYDPFSDLKNPYPFQFIFYIDILQFIPNTLHYNHCQIEKCVTHRKSKAVFQLLKNETTIFTCPYYHFVFEILDLEDYINLHFQMENNKMINCTVLQVNLHLSINTKCTKPYDLSQKTSCIVNEFLQVATQMKQRTGKPIQRLNIQFTNESLLFPFIYFVLEQCIALRIVETFYFHLEPKQIPSLWIYLEPYMSYIYEKTQKPIFLPKCCDQLPFVFNSIPYVFIMNWEELIHSEPPFYHSCIQYYEIEHRSQNSFFHGSINTYFNMCNTVFEESKGRLVFFPTQNKSHFYPQIKN